MTTVAQALRGASRRLTDAGVGAPNRDARRLLAYVLHTDTAQLSVMGPDVLSDGAKSAFDSIVEQRCQRQPVSHLIGYRDFWKSRFRVTPAVLDPRPETESLVSRALAEPFSRVLDLGTGSGAILISLLLERPNARGVGTDISPEAILIAGENADALGVADRITLPLSDWFDDVGGRYDLIVSNPPYIAVGEMAALDAEVRDFEPRLALTDEGDGLSAYREISRGACDHLSPNGRILVEIGPTQASPVTALFRAEGFDHIQIYQDLDGRDRVVEARFTT